MSVTIPDDRIQIVAERTRNRIHLRNQLRYDDITADVESYRWTAEPHPTNYTVRFSINGADHNALTPDFCGVLLQIVPQTRGNRTHDFARTSDYSNFKLATHRVVLNFKRNQ